MKKLFWGLVFPAAVLVGLYFGGTYAYENRLYAPISDKISDETKQKLRDTILVFEAKAELEREVADLTRRLERTTDVQELFEVALRNNPNLPEDLPFDRVSQEVLEAGRDRFEVTRYETPFVPLSHFGRRAYVETHDGALLLITAKGTVGRVPLEEIAGASFYMDAIHTNLPDLIPNTEFYEINQFSIKDALVQDGRLLLSYSKVLRPGCYTLAIAAATLSEEELVFQDIFVPDECVDEDNDYGIFQPNQTGGRMLSLGPGRLMFSTGEWGVHPLAQDPASLFGKVVEINLSTGAVTPVSMGHRNPQGLYHDPAANLVVVAEHGPSGGDEININRSTGGAPENYGWPIASYGEHYSATPEILAVAPLHKSHADHGFVEPEIFFEVAISPSEILRLAPDPREPERYSLLMGAMGFDYREGDQSLYVFDLDADFKITSRERIILQNRVRDMVHLPGTQTYVLYLEGGDEQLGALALVRHLP